ncbi:PAS domain-containing protein [Pseudanabaenaceae cyanobacterium LEGE 13415]|nr:PAS domain-containing protein [Pseudanabaenaceae cyanobacterium LEGE 13415]
MTETTQSSFSSEALINASATGIEFCNITDKHQYASQQRYQELAEALPQLVWTADSALQIEYANQQWHDFTGLTIEQARDFDQLRPLLPPEDWDRLFEQWAIAAETKTSFKIEGGFKNAATGIFHTFLVYIVPIQDEHGQIVRWHGTCTDITDLKRTQTAFAQSEERLKLALEATGAAVWDWNCITGEAWTSEEYHNIFGIPPGSKPLNYDTWLNEFVHPDDRAWVKEVMQQVLIQRQPEFSIEYRILHPEGVRWVVSQGKTVYNTNGEPIRAVGTVLNITARKQIEKEREQLLQDEQTLRELAERANCIKDEFLAVVSHELRTPLTPILGWVQLLREGRLKPEQVAKTLATIEHSAKQLAQMIDDLLDVPRILRNKLTLTMHPLNPTPIVANAIETVRLSAEAKSIQLESFLTSDVAQVMGDAGRLQQVVCNLLTNAIKFTPRHGRVEVYLEQVDRLVQIQVKDTGKGIHPNFLPHLFEAFQQEDRTTTRNFGGLGLGLAIVRQLVKLHGGTVNAESLGEGHGATFTVQLPIAQSHAMQTEDPVSDLQAVDLSGVRILVVDDVPDSRDYIAFVLEQAGASLATAGSAQEALARWSQVNPNLLISDIGMPETDGYQLLQHIRSHVAEFQMIPAGASLLPKAIALTAYASEVDQQQVLDAGFQRHLAKPIDPVTLVRTVAQLIA